MTNIQFQLCATSMTPNYVSDLNHKLIPGDYEIALIQNDIEGDVVKSEIQKTLESEVDQVFDKITQRDDTNVSDKQCDDSVGDVPLEIEDEYVNIVNSRNLVDMVFDESLHEESLPKRTTLNEGQEVTFKLSIMDISEQRMHSNPLIIGIPNGINLYSNETELDVNNLSLLAKVHGNYTLLELGGGGTSYVDSLCTDGQPNFLASHFKESFLLKCFMVPNGDIKCELPDVGSPALRDSGAGVIAPRMSRLACLLWDYLRSGAYGFLLSLFGGADSSSTAAIVGSMYLLVIKEIAKGNSQVTTDAFLIGRYTDGQFQTVSKGLDKHIINTVFMGSKNSSETTITQAKVLANKIAFVRSLMVYSKKGWIEKDKYFLEFMEKYYGESEHSSTNEEIHDVLSVVFCYVISYPLLKYVLLILITDDSGFTCTHPKERRTFEAYVFRKSTFLILVVVSSSCLLTGNGSGLILLKLVLFYGTWVDYPKSSSSNFIIGVVVILSIGFDEIQYESLMELPLTKDDNSIATLLFNGLQPKLSESILVFGGDNFAEQIPVDSRSMENMEHDGFHSDFSCESSIPYELATSVLALSTGQGFIQMYATVLPVSGRMSQHLKEYKFGSIHIGGAACKAWICRDFSILVVAYLLLRCGSILMIMPVTFSILLLGVGYGLAWKPWTETVGVLANCQESIPWCFVSGPCIGLSFLGIYTKFYNCGRCGCNVQNLEDKPFLANIEPNLDLTLAHYPPSPADLLPNP
ncbi:glutamine-dependent nad(+) synthetase [Nicotiana attenuata]|uniref:Glutamine-dependent nad(+) synthetase n=1 Tax=Nicotiana attenuata TaxID=49451 RepID=A0A314KQH8_NICAT|nr:glutamine-dependent nad(+) synthetase [Nicotiana attenuata]